MADTASFDFIFEPEKDISREHLLQGDLLLRTPELKGAIGAAHDYYATAPDYTHFLVLTQSCDLVLRKGKCKSRYVTICAVRPLSLAVDREFERFINPVSGCPIPVGNLENNVLARQFLERVLNNTVDGMFFIPKGSAATVTEHLCAFLPLSVALRAEEHYQTLLGAKVGQVKAIFAAKIGSLASNLYSRIATPDLHEHHEASAVSAYTKLFLKDLGHSSVAWLSPYQRETLTARIGEKLAEAGGEEISEAQAAELLQSLPSEIDAIAARVVTVLSDRGLIANDADAQRKARNFLLNDREIRRLATR